MTEHEKGLWLKMFKNQNRFLELYKALDEKVEVFKGILWTEYQRMVQPVGSAKLDYSISKEEAKFLLSKFPNALLVRYTRGFGNNPEINEWYAVINDKFLELDKIPSKNRSEIRRGLRNCSVKLVGADLIADKGYRVFMGAFERYKGIRKPQITEKDFKKGIEITRNFSDIIDYWGVFYQDDLIAYSVVYKYDNIEAGYSTIKLLPKYLKFYPSYAFIQNKYYLQENHFEYVNDGFRSILHQSNIQNFLIDKFNFRKEYVDLKVFYKPWVNYLVPVSFPFRHLLEKLNPKLQSLYKLEEIRKKYEKSAT